MAPSRDISAGRSPQGWRAGEAPAILGTAERDGREQGEVRGFPENKAVAGSQRRGGRVSCSCSSWGRGKAQKAPGVCVLSPWQPRLHHRHGPQGRPGQNELLREKESSGQAQQRPIYTG